MRIIWRRDAHGVIAQVAIVLRQAALYQTPDNNPKFSPR